MMMMNDEWWLVTAGGCCTVACKVQMCVLLSLSLCGTIEFTTFYSTMPQRLHS